MNGLIFDIQTFALYDGPGIRTAVFFKGCPLHCHWCHNPESIQPHKQLRVFKNRCVQCGACIASCPQTNDLLGKRSLPYLDHAQCKTCGACVRACVHGARELVGYEISSQELVELVGRDREFFKTSRGGVTLTGGEPTRQRGFLLEVLKGFREAGVHTAVETCGHFSRDLVEPLAALADLVLFDLKHIDPQLHEAATGVSNQRILENFQALFEILGSACLWPRIPLIPGFNTDQATLSAMRDWLGKIGYQGLVHLMPGHGMAKSKYEGLGLSGCFRPVEAMSSAEQAQALLAFSGRDLEPVWGG